VDKVHDMVAVEVDTAAVVVDAQMVVVAAAADSFGSAGQQ